MPVFSPSLLVIEWVGRSGFFRAKVNQRVFVSIMNRNINSVNVDPDCLVGHSRGDHVRRGEGVAVHTIACNWRAVWAHHVMYTEPRAFRSLNPRTPHHQIAGRLEAARLGVTMTYRSEIWLVSRQQFCRGASRMQLWSGNSKSIYSAVPL